MSKSRSPKDLLFLASFSTRRNLAWESFCTKMEGSTKDHGKMIRKMARATKNTQAEIYISESTRWENLKEWESIFGLTDKCTKGSGLMECDKVLELGEELKMIAISASGTMANLKALGFCFGPMEIGIKATSKKG